MAQALKASAAREQQLRSDFVAGWGAIEADAFAMNAAHSAGKQADHDDHLRTFAGSAGRPETEPLVFYIETVRQNVSGTGTVSVKRVDVTPVGGVLTTPNLDPVQRTCNGVGSGTRS